MLTWQIGDVSVTRVVEMEIPVPYDPDGAMLADATPQALAEIPWLSPHFVTDDGALRLSIHALVVNAPGLNLVVYKRAMRRGITSADCVNLTWVGAALLVCYHLWIVAGLPGVGA